MKIRDRIIVITDLVLGGVHSDAGMREDEARAVRELIGELLLCEPDALPIDVDMRIRCWDPARFDLEKSAADFLRDPPMKPRRLLELLSALTDRDGIDLREDAYLRRLGRALRMSPAAYRDLVLQYDDEITTVHKRPPAMPPPIPEHLRRKAS